ncbi:aldo/keto reductase [Flavobacteriaceae bacterium]|jgi:aryl-alcohol dehydrogenase-like predicted oxidoreductase|nr:aldo/keto reductase [Flavobacteriaceae bacterium]MDA9067355.1 aldo/keto reductase [Flavobacteriaceae bacterium]MDC1320908.1 aldo/keto reductase [Flavobacteriaceae bacterium]
MKYNKIPHTEIKVSKICLGTMTWGNQNSEKEAFEQLDLSVERGVNFIDTAELYPVPAEAETSGRTSEIIGKWLRKKKNRDKLVIATKIAGPGDYTKHIRTGGFSPKSIEDAINKSLKRLQTDYIDLYQLHWPERSTNFFGIRDYKHNYKDKWNDNFNEILNSLDGFVKQGKIRNIGISNEKSWGAMRYIEESNKCNLPRVVTIQNAYSLLNRPFEGDLAEISIREGLGLLAYSPLGFGVLTGKYIKGTASDNARLKLFPRFSRYSSTEATNATKEYLKIALDNQLSLTQMSLAFVNQQPFVTSNIIGATNLKQLEENISSIEVNLSEEVLSKINEVHSKIPNPSP